VKNDILMFHRLMRAMPLNRTMSVDEICDAVQNDGGGAVLQCNSLVSRVLLIDENIYFEHPENDRWRRVRDYKPMSVNRP
jgi:hypothetical protein